ncbi:hypothetical protein [Salinibacter altiplanensis]|uniref:hypothetical protein n=1 Tax=Salinibacter altiplanensis TaxID=1803181 RepID=UPI000C9FF441|nr:hypothetical protein [Salinibacter altiplanensis]
MKNQYFGDINDYYKYGLLRALLRPASMDLLVGWMLTPDEGSTDGRKTSYLDRPDRYRSLDPELFDFLSRAVQNDQRRGVSAIEETGLLPRASYFSRFIPDGRNERSGYFDALLSMGGTSSFSIRTTGWRSSRRTEDTKARRNTFSSMRFSERGRRAARY